MIDLRSEELLPLKELPEKLPKRNGRPLSLATIYRWTTVGFKGVVLETAVHGGLTVTSMEAVARFDEACTNSRKRVSMNPPTKNHVNKSHQRAKERLGLSSSP